jgi:hypothetical protein
MDSSMVLGSKMIPNVAGWISGGSRRYIYSVTTNETTFSGLAYLGRQKQGLRNERKGPRSLNEHKKYWHSKAA